MFLSGEMLSASSCRRILTILDALFMIIVPTLQPKRCSVDVTADMLLLDIQLCGHDLMYLQFR